MDLQINWTAILCFQAYAVIFLRPSTVIWFVRKDTQKTEKYVFFCLGHLKWFSFTLFMCSKARLSQSIHSVISISEYRKSRTNGKVIELNCWSRVKPGEILCLQIIRSIQNMFIKVEKHLNRRMIKTKLINFLRYLTIAKEGWWSHFEVLVIINSFMHRKHTLSYGFILNECMTLSLKLRRVFYLCLPLNYL